MRSRRAVLTAIEHRPYERRVEHRGFADRIAVLGAHRRRVLEQERLLLLQPLRQLVHCLLVTLLIEAGKSGNRLLDILGGYDVRGHDRRRV